LTASVVICAYTEERWSLLERSVDSVKCQTRIPAEILLCVDHNEALLRRCRDHWGNEPAGSSIPMTVLANQYEGHLGSARNSAVEMACGDIVVFLDDDACAETDWLERLLLPYECEDVVAVGGAPVPEFEGTRPRWFPTEFDWVFGCAYTGLPEIGAPLARLIGANMSVRRLALEKIGGFRSDNHDDMDMCHRLAYHLPTEQILYQPAALVHHFVPSQRTTWTYFWRRCFTVNKGKVEAFRMMEGAGGLSADLRFVLTTASRGVSLGLRKSLAGDPWGAARAGAILVGVSLAGVGHAVGQAQWHLFGRWRRPPSGNQTVRLCAQPY
jgi:GT2 family glycosyltransferase